MIDIVWVVGSLYILLLILFFGFCDRDHAVDLCRMAWRRGDSKPAKWPRVDESNWPLVMYSAPDSETVYDAVPKVGSVHPYREGWTVWDVSSSRDISWLRAGARFSPLGPEAMAAWVLHRDAEFYAIVTYAPGRHVMLPTMEAVWQT